jgi:hypothetical protein
MVYMNFQIRFQTEGYQYLTYIESVDIGTEGIDFIRDQLNLDLEISRIEEKNAAYKASSKLIGISENIARETGYFVSQNTIEVICSAKYFNQFSTKNVESRKNNETGEVFFAKIYYNQNSEEIISAWKKAGYPLKWGFEEETEEN